jgi:hypothetical protein
MNTTAVTSLSLIKYTLEVRKKAATKDAVRLLFVSCLTNTYISIDDTKYMANTVTTSDENKLRPDV